MPGAPGQARCEFLLLEKLVEANLDRLFPGMEILGASAFRVTRDADIEIREDEAGDLLAASTENVRAPALRRGHPPRGREALPRDTCASCSATSSSSSPSDVYEVDGPLGAADLISAS